MKATLILFCKVKYEQKNNLGIPEVKETTDVTRTYNLNVTSAGDS